MLSFITVTGQLAQWFDFHSVCLYFLPQNKIPVDENPAYEEVTQKQSRIDVQENSAYSAYNPYSIIN